MVKTLTAEQQAAIAATFHDPNVLVQMSSLSRTWATRRETGETLTVFAGYRAGDPLATIKAGYTDPATSSTIKAGADVTLNEEVNGYLTRIMGMSPLRQAVDPLGGVAEQADFSVTIQQETPTQFIQDLEPDNEAVTVALKYPGHIDDATAFTLLTARLDRWEFRAGLLTLHCIANLKLSGATLPTEQITADDFSSFVIPTHVLGKWVPLTIGSHATARGLLIDKTIGGQKVKFNAAVSGHAGIGALTTGYIWLDSAKEFLMIDTSAGATPLTAPDAGHLLFGVTTVTQHGLVALILRIVPNRALVDESDPDLQNGWSDPEDSIDEDFTTYAEAANIAPLLGDPPPPDGNADIYLRLQLRELAFPEAIIVREDRLFILADMDRLVGGNLAGAEVCEAAIELVEGTYPAIAALQEHVIATGDNAFDNLNELDDAETDVAFDTSEYASRIGLDLDGSGTGETLPAARIGNRFLSLKYTEVQGLGQVSKSLKVMELRLRIDMQTEALTQEYHAELGGYDDDSSGTYTGSANALIENPADVLHFLLAQLLGFSDITTADFTAARSALSSYVLAGQLLELTDARDALNRIARQSKLMLFLDLDDQWAVTALSLPGTEDRELGAGDFVAEGEAGIEGEITSITQTPLGELYNQFEILYDWNAATGAFQQRLVLDETTTGPIGNWLTESQSRYNLTRKLVVQLAWIRDTNSVRSFGNHLIYQYADRKRLVQFQTALNAADLEIGDTVRLTHADMQVVEDTTVFAGYRAGDPLATIKAGYTDPDTAAVIKVGAKVELNEGRHRYRLHTIETDPMRGKIGFTARQADISRSELSEPW